MFSILSLIHSTSILQYNLQEEQQEFRNTMVKQETKSGWGRKKRDAKPRGRHAKKHLEDNMPAPKSPIYDENNNHENKQVRILLKKANNTMITQQQT